MSDKVDEYMGWAYEKSYASNRKMWIAVGGMCFFAILALVAVGSVMALLPLHKIEPVVITINKDTGVSNVVSDLKGDNMEETEAIIYSEVAKYITFREAYFYHTYVDSYKKAVQMSAGKAREDLISNFAPDQPSGPMKKFLDNIQVNLKWTSFSLLGEDIVQVRFVKNTISKLKKKGKRTHHIATVKFHHIEDAQMSLVMRMVNPHAFVCTDYQLTQEGF